MQDRVHLERPVEIRLAVEDGDFDIATAGEDVLQFGSRSDGDRQVAGFPELLLDSSELGPRQGYDYDDGDGDG
jgi:ATP phosphoribosyltransferase